MRLPTVAILASGEGTTAETFIKAYTDQTISAEVRLVISNNPNAGVFNRVQTLNKKYNLSIDCVHIGKQNYPADPDEQLQLGQQTAAEEAAILDILKQGKFDAILLLGYMKRVGLKLVREFGWREEYTSPYQACMLNTHPGLLPETKGLYGIYVQEFVLQQRLPEAGQTLHIVAENYDEGPTIAEHRIKVSDSDTAESLFERVKQVEKGNIAQDVNEFLMKRQAYLERNSS